MMITHNVVKSLKIFMLANQDKQRLNTRDFEARVRILQPLTIKQGDDS